MDVLYELITKHLSSEYKVVELEKRRVTEDGSEAPIEYDVLNIHGESIKGHKICEYIAETFGLSKQQSIYLVSAWLLREGMDEDSMYFRTIKVADLGNLFPLIEQVQSRTLALDLVPVESLQTPVGNLIYLDFVYGKQSKWKRFWNKCWKGIKRIFIK